MSADRADALLDDILAGPSALAELLDAYGDPRGPLAGIGAAPGRVAFVGLGSSRYAALTAAAELRSRGVAAWSEYASSGAPTAPSGDLVVVAVSASGTTRRRSSRRPDAIAATAGSWR